MSYINIDKYSQLSSPVHRLDPVIKLITGFTFIFIIVSEPAGAIAPLIPYFLVCAALVIASRIPLLFLLSRLSAGLLFVIMAAVFYPLSGAGTDSVVPDGLLPAKATVMGSMLLKGIISLTVLILITSTGRFDNMLTGLRRLNMPKPVTVIAALMYRYIFIIHDEALRTTRARESRTPGKIVSGRIATLGNQFGLVFMRSIDRSQGIYNAMTSRGFKGEFPSMCQTAAKKRDIFLAILFILALLVLRFY